MNENETSTHIQTGRERRNPVTVGWIVLVALIVLAVIEYGAAQVMTTKNLPLMIVMNIVDAALIMVYFMHLPRLWRHHGEDE